MDELQELLEMRPEEFYEEQMTPTELAEFESIERAQEGSEDSTDGPY